MTASEILGNMSGRLSDALNNITKGQSGGSFDNAEKLKQFADSMMSLAETEQQASILAAKLSQETARTEKKVNYSKQSAEKALKHCVTAACNDVRDEVSVLTTLEESSHVNALFRFK